MRFVDRDGGTGLVKLIVIAAVFVMFVVAGLGCGRTKKGGEEAKTQAAEAEQEAQAERASSEAKEVGAAAEEAGGEAAAEGQTEEATSEAGEATSEEETAASEEKAEEGEAEGTTGGGEEAEAELEEISLTEADNGKEIDLALGQVLVVTLASDQTTEFRWDVAPFVEPVVKRAGERVYTPSKPEGTGGKTTLRFKAVSKGRGPLLMVYERPGERNLEPKKKFSVMLVVR
jgi:inhibitor of cysteine peptidase